MAQRFQRTARAPLPPAVLRRARAARRGSTIGGWFHAADGLLRRLSGGDRVVHLTLRVASVPMLLGLLLALSAILF